MNRRWYDDGRDDAGGLTEYHHYWNDGGGGGLQARREARNKVQGSFSSSRPSPTSVTSLFNMPSPSEDSPSILLVDQSLIGEGGSPTLNGISHKPRPHFHDSLYQQDSSFSKDDCKPRSTHMSTPGAQMMSNSFDAVSRKLAAFDHDPVATERRIEIAPGLSERLRGADETWQAIENDFYLPCMCLVCNQDICCIMDATYVLCPVCKVVSPLENGCEAGGVGLGFTNDDLQKWQTEIILSRRR